MAAARVTLISKLPSDLVIHEQGYVLEEIATVVCTRLRMGDYD